MEIVRPIVAGANRIHRGASMSFGCSLKVVVEWGCLGGNDVLSSGLRSRGALDDAANMRDRLQAALGIGEPPLNPIFVHWRLQNRERCFALASDDQFEFLVLPDVPQCNNVLRSIEEQGLFHQLRGRVEADSAEPVTLEVEEPQEPATRPTPAPPASGPMTQRSLCEVFEALLAYSAAEPIPTFAIGWPSRETLPEATFDTALVMPPAPTPLPAQLAERADRLRGELAELAAIYNRDGRGNNEFDEACLDAKRLADLMQQSSGIGMVHVELCSQIGKRLSEYGASVQGRTGAAGRSDAAARKYARLAAQMRNCADLPEPGPPEVGARGSATTSVPPDDWNGAELQHAPRGHRTGDGPAIDRMEQDPAADIVESSAGLANPGDRAIAEQWIAPSDIGEPAAPSAGSEAEPQPTIAAGYATEPAVASNSGGARSAGRPPVDWTEPRAISASPTADRNGGRQSARAVREEAAKGRWALPALSAANQALLIWIAGASIALNLALGAWLIVDHLPARKPAANPRGPAVRVQIGR